MHNDSHGHPHSQSSSASSYFTSRQSSSLRVILHRLRRHHSQRQTSPSTLNSATHHERAITSSSPSPSSPRIMNPNNQSPTLARRIRLCFPCNSSHQQHTANQRRVTSLPPGKVSTWKEREWRGEGGGGGEARNSRRGQRRQRRKRWSDKRNDLVNGWCVVIVAVVAAACRLERRGRSGGGKDGRKTFFRLPRAKRCRRVGSEDVLFSHVFFFYCQIRCIVRFLWPIARIQPPRTRRDCNSGDSITVDAQQPDWKVRLGRRICHQSENSRLLAWVERVVMVMTWMMRVEKGRSSRCFSFWLCACDVLLLWC